MSPRLVRSEYLKPNKWNQFHRVEAVIVINANAAGRHMGRPLRENHDCETDCCEWRGPVKGIGETFCGEVWRDVLSGGRAVLFMWCYAAACVDPHNFFGVGLGKSCSNQRFIAWCRLFRSGSAPEPVVFSRATHNQRSWQTAHWRQDIFMQQR